jgi:uncharacterized OsmC-like protein
MDKFTTFKLDMPTEFGGKGSFPCPEELLLSSVGGCLLTTLVWFKRQMHITSIDGLTIGVEGTWEKMREGYRITRIDAGFKFQAKEYEREKVEKCVEMAKTFCHITRSLEKGIPINVNTEITYSLPE